MKVSPDGIDFLTHEEGLRLTAYHDSRGVPTIGYGHTGVDVTHADVTAGRTITHAEAEAFFRKDLERFELIVLRVTPATLTQGQFDALVSLAYNIGAVAFAGSTLVRKLKAGDAKGACCEFVKWKKAGADPDRLLARRAREAWTFARATPAG